MGKKPGSAKSGGGMLDSRTFELRRQVSNKLFARARGHVALNDPMPKKLVLDPPGVQEKSRITQGNDVDIVMATTDFCFGYHSAYEALRLESADNPAGKAKIHSCLSSEPSDRVSAVVGKEVARDTRAVRRENILRSTRLLEQVGPALDSNQ